MFSILLKTYNFILAAFNLSSANGFDLDQPKSLLFGNGFIMLHVLWNNLTYLLFYFQVSGTVLSSI